MRTGTERYASAEQRVATLRRWRFLFEESARNSDYARACRRELEQELREAHLKAQLDAVSEMPAPFSNMVRR